ncbi:hypothetical protein QK292_17770 [Arthrobacter sp. AL08]|uniref:hypothetical protein n=1 Tax=Micrococcaceae TaxID=1268 RepID=UPI00249C08FC|nr:MULTISPECIES: hypothetical protein [Micrococcaceae]MDI3243392.1 hypothetical protein [Arthrobacter sp. AL05]MDI3279401.1 hypothetical protein [Arthrobacter sp. AL08]MDJ0354347.1 hypothetical protein [Pseudarthrobacter sp. PH31-O2]
MLRPGRCCPGSGTVSPDLEAGYGNLGDTLRWAIGAGVVGSNIEDRMRPLAETVKQMGDPLLAKKREEIDFVLSSMPERTRSSGQDTRPSAVLTPSNAVRLSWTPERPAPSFPKRLTRRLWQRI